MNLEQLRQRARDLSGVQSTAIKSNDEFDVLINEANVELSGVENWPWLYTDDDVAVDAEAPEVETAPFRTIEGALFNGVRLHNVALADVDEAAIDRLDEPYAYARLGHDRLLLVPTPEVAGTLKLRGYRQAAALVSGSDSPEFDPEFHHILAYAAASRALIQEGDDSGRSGAYGQEVAGLIAGMRERYMQSHEKSVFQWGGRADSRPRYRLR